VGISRRSSERSAGSEVRPGGLLGDCVRDAAGNAVSRCCTPNALAVGEHVVRAGRRSFRHRFPELRARRSLSIEDKPIEIRDLVFFSLRGQA
jgi:hypothetical protein